MTDNSSAPQLRRKRTTSNTGVARADPSHHARRRTAESRQLAGSIADLFVAMPKNGRQKPETQPAGRCAADDTDGTRQPAMVVSLGCLRPLTTCCLQSDSTVLLPCFQRPREFTDLLNTRGRFGDRKPFHSGHKSIGQNETRNKF